MSRTEQPWDHPPELSQSDSENHTAWRSGYNDAAAALMARFCQLAHLPFEPAAAAPPGGPEVTTDRGREHLEESLKAGAFRLVTIFDKENAQAFLAVRENYFAVLAFRGTQGREELLHTDANLRRVPLPGARGVAVHCGFLEAFTRCRKEIEATLDAAVRPPLALYVTGHSLGGALGQLASAALNRDNLVACYTFGSPRVGTRDFAQQVKCPNYRIVNNWDLVPGVPLPWFRGYRHTGEARLLIPGRMEALRRDRWHTGLLVDLMAVVVGSLISHKLLITDDHMIWNYRKRLDEIVAANLQRH
jgi:triacylglycerol lipase